MEARRHRSRYAAGASLNDEDSHGTQQPQSCQEVAMSEPKIAAKQPAAVPLEAGKTYAWCACGLSTTQPFCDGSHKITDLTPMVFTAEKTETAYLCQCKRSKSAPFCDGTHKSLTGC
jgi:CDGSH iron-sulfur domain-containing protein 3